MQDGTWAAVDVLGCGLRAFGACHDSFSESMDADMLQKSSYLDLLGPGHTLEGVRSTSQYRFLIFQPINLLLFHHTLASNAFRRA